MDFFYYPHFEQNTLLLGAAFAGFITTVSFIVACALYTFADWLSYGKVEDFFHGIGGDIFSIALMLFYGVIFLELNAISYHYGFFHIFEALWGFFFGIIISVVVLGNILDAGLKILKMSIFYSKRALAAV